MNFELEKELSELLKSGQLDKAIEVAERELRKLPTTDFHKVLDKDLLHLKKDLSQYIQNFYKSAKTSFQ